MNILTSLPFTVKELCEADHLFRVGDSTHEAQMRGFTQDEYEQWLSNKFNRQVTCIGAGYYSKVFEVDGYEGQVIKICSYSADDRWLQYAEVVKDCHDSWCPRIDFIETHRYFYVAVIEKLTPFNHEADVWDISDASSSELHDVYENTYKNLFTWAWASKTVESLNINKDNSEYYNIKSALSTFNKLINICDTRGLSIACDIHARNVMLRGDQMVLTDPVML